jgi:hypothetical protein
MNIVFVVIWAVVVDNKDQLFDVESASGDGCSYLKTVCSNIIML